MSENTPDGPAQEVYQEKVLTAGYDLLSALHNLTFHHGDGQDITAQSRYYGITDTMATLRGVAEAAARIAGEAVKQLDQADAVRDWMTSQRPKRCANCGDDIDVTYPSDLRICRGAAEHDWCHIREATTDDEDTDRASVRDEDEQLAYCEDRMRTGGPRHGDSVELTLPNGRTVRGDWYVPGPAPLGAPIVLDWSDDSEVPTEGAQVQVIGVGDDAGAWVTSLEDLERDAQLAAALQEVAAAIHESPGDESRAGVVQPGSEDTGSSDADSSGGVGEELA